MSAIRLRGATSGTTDVVAAAIAGDGVLTLPTGTGTLATAAYVDAAVAAGGKVLQVVSVTKVNAFTTTSTSFVDVTGLTVTITPSATSSKILIMSTFQASNSDAAFDYFNLVRNSTAIAQGTGASNNMTAAAYAGHTSNSNGIYQVAITNLDSPATTSATTYKIQMAVNTGTGAVGRRGEDTLVAVSSNILVMEISA